MTRSATVQIRRIYDAPDASEGQRVLIDRLWPRGISKERADLTAWLRDVAPSNELRRWYEHDPAKYGEFARRYQAELQEPGPAQAFTHLQDIARQGPLTLLTSTKSVEISHAKVLQDLLNGSDGQPA